MLLNLKQEGSPVICVNMDEPGRHIKRNKRDRER